MRAADRERALDVLRARGYAHPEGFADEHLARALSLVEDESGPVPDPQTDTEPAAAETGPADASTESHPEIVDELVMAPELADADVGAAGGGLGVTQPRPSTRRARRKAQAPAYQWYTKDWFTSETRLRMNLAERGACRDLLDYCALEGSIPDDLKGLARIAACSVEEMGQVWPAMRDGFVKDRHRAHRLINPKIELVRKNRDKYVQQQRAKGLASAAKKRQKSGPVGPTESTGRATAASTGSQAASATASSSPSPTANLSSSTASPLHSARPARQDAAAGFDFPKTLEVLRGYFPSVTQDFATKLVEVSREVEPAVDDYRLALAVEQTYRGSQTSAGLFLLTVPEWLNRNPPQPKPREYRPPVDAAFGGWEQTANVVLEYFDGCNFVAQVVAAARTAEPGITDGRLAEVLDWGVNVSYAYEDSDSDGSADSFLKDVPGWVRNCPPKPKTGIFS